MSTLGTTGKSESARIGGQINQGVSAGVITDAMVNANATLTLLKAAILAASYHGNKRIALLVNLGLDKAKSLGLMSETHGVTTTAGLLALTDAPSSTYKQNFND